VDIDAARSSNHSMIRKSRRNDFPPGFANTFNQETNHECADSFAAAARRKANFDPGLYPPKANPNAQDFIMEMPLAQELIACLSNESSYSISTP
jgi:hypothetical protein